MTTKKNNIDLSDFEFEDDGVEYNENLMSGSPFSQEFDSDNVINRESEMNPFDIDFDEDDNIDGTRQTKDKIEPMLKPSDLDLEEYLNEDEEKIKSDNFRSVVSQKANSEEISGDDTSFIFKDFLRAPKISGKRKSGLTSTSRFPSELLKSRGRKVEIADDPALKNLGKSQSTVIIHRDEAGEVEMIEIISVVGDRTLIKFEQTDVIQDFDLTEIHNPLEEEEIVDEVDLPGSKIVPLGLSETKSKSVSQVSSGFGQVPAIQGTGLAAMKQRYPALKNIDDKIAEILINMKFYW